MSSVLSGVRCSVITISDSKSQNESQDLSGPTAVEILEASGAEVVAKVVLPDEPDAITRTLLDHVEHRGVDLIVTSGGTGVAPRDRTPETTEAFCERLIPGIPEYIRSISVSKTPHASLSRGVCGIRGKTIILNLAGSPGAVRDGLSATIGMLSHAVELVTQSNVHHQQT